MFQGKERGLDGESALGLPCFGKAAPFVIGGMIDETGADGVGVEIGAHGFGGKSFFNDGTAKTALPKGTLFPSFTINKAGHSLHEISHEFREIVHASKEGFLQFLALCFAGRFPGGFKFCKRLAVQGGTDPFEKFLFIENSFRFGGNGHNEVKVIRHNDIGQDPDPGKANSDLELFYELISRHLVDEGEIHHDTGRDMMDEFRGLGESGIGTLG